MQTKGEDQAGRAGVWYHLAVQVPVELPFARQQLFDAVGLGLNTTDVLAVVAEYPEPGSKMPIRKLATLPGGQTATAMTAVSRLGWAARYVGRFGDDANGKAGRESLRAAGVDITACATVVGATNALSLILVDEHSGQRTVLWSRHPSLTIKAADVSEDAVRSGRVLLVDCHETPAATVAARYARAAGIPTVIDVERVRPGIEDLLGQIDIIITAQDFPSALTGIGELGHALRTLSESFRAAVVCTTLGEEGSLAVVDGVEIRTPGFSVPVADTTGAGDAFRGGFIAGWLQAGSDAVAEDVLRYANAVAALKCRALGARAGIPTRAEVETLLKGQAV